MIRVITKTTTVVGITSKITTITKGKTIDILISATKSKMTVTTFIITTVISKMITTKI